jgi:histidine ammonia-lyase
VSENKTLCFPASVDSIAVDTTEDHVSMGSVAARKAARVIANTANALALELVCACQALEFAGVAEASPAARAVHALVREDVAPLDRDRGLHAEVEALGARILAGDVGAAVRQVLPAPVG